VMKCPKIDFGGGYKTQNRLKPYNFHHFTWQTVEYMPKRKGSKQREISHMSKKEW
jgi:hypothetical protein